MTPIIIPLGAEPHGKYQELRFTLRSISKFYKDEGYPVVIVGPDRPAWLKNAFFVVQKDERLHKDANMIDKILTGIVKLKELGYSGRFTKFSDDAILLGPYDPAEKPKCFSPMQDTLSRLPEGLWRERFARTATYLQDRIRNPLNFETHTPQPYDTDTFSRLMAEVPYTEGIGYVINSVYLNQVADDAEMITVDPNCKSRLCALKMPGYSMYEIQSAVNNCRFLETDNAAFAKGSLQKFLQNRFKKSRFEA